MKKFITSLAMIVLLSAAVSGQVGVNNTAPESTLDIKAQDLSTTATNNEGILIPRLSKTRVAQIGTANLKEATQVYVDDVTYTGSNTAVSDINQKGFYYYDPSGKWKTISLDKNLYTSDGTLSTTRTVTLGGYDLTFDTGSTTNKVVISGSSTTNPKLEVNVIVKSSATLYTSDVRLKKNIVPVVHALETIKQLKAVEYDKKDNMDATQYNVHELGFIAQDLQKVLPQIVVEGTDKDKTLTVNYTALIPLLVQALQEQQAEIEALKQELK